MNLTLTIDLDPSLLLGVIGKMPMAVDVRREPMRGAFGKASTALMRYENARFASASGGDGTWREHAYTTKRKRLERQAKLAGSKTRITSRLILGVHLPILIVFGDLEASLFNFGAAGHFQIFDESGVSEGAGDGEHPDAHMSFGALANLHHHGSVRKHIPARPVMADPDQATVNMIGVEIGAGVNGVFAQLAAQVGGGGARVA